MAVKWSSEEWAGQSMLLDFRAAGRCELCGERITRAAHRHHRQRRGVGGDRLSNLVLLHPECHWQVHGSPEGARAEGFIVSSYAADPALVPVRIRGRLVLLTDDGDYLDPTLDGR